MKRSTTHPARWLALALAVDTAIALIDWLAPGKAVLIGVLVAGPLVAALRLSVRLTNVVVAYALALAAIGGVVDDFFGTLDHQLRTLAVVVGGFLALLIARVREEREQTAGALEAQQAVSRILAEAETLAQATPRILPEMGRTLGWDLGAIWEVDRARGEIAVAQTWTAAAVRSQAGEFQAVTREKRMRRGQGLPGSVWERSQPRWMVDVRADPDFSRIEPAAEAGLISGAGFPIRSGEDTLGVIELFSLHRREPDPRMLDMMAAFGRQIGQFIDRKRADAAVRDSEAMKAAILSGALDAIIAMDHEGRVLDFNPAAERIFGYEAGEAVGQELAALIIPAELRDQHRDGLARFLETGEGSVFNRRLELTGMRKNGQTFPAELTVSRIEFAEPPIFSGQVRDITDRRRSESELRRSRDQLEVILQGVADGVIAQDPGGRLVFANDAAVRVLGFPDPATLISTSPDEVMGRFAIFGENGERFPVERLPGRHALGGEDPPDVTLRFADRETGEERWLVVKARPIRGADGAVVMVINIFEDVTDQMRREASQRFLAEASKALAASLDYETTLRGIASLSVPRLADWAVIDVLDERGELVSVALEHEDPRMVERAETMRKRYPPVRDESRGAYQVLSTGEPQLWPEIPDSLLRKEAQGEEHYQLIKELEMRSAMLIPMTAPDGVLGTMTFVSKTRRFDQEDLSLAVEIGHRAGLAIANSRLYSERAHIARTLQDSLLPPRLPVIPGIDAAARFRAAGSGNEVGGDFYDLFEVGETGGWAIVIGDVCGKGPEAAAITALARYTLRAAALQAATPSAALGVLNDAMLAQRADKRFCSVAYTSLATGAANGGGIGAQVASGGHPLPVVLRADGSVERAGHHGTLIGIVPDPDLIDADLRLDRGDSLILFTDGVTEVRRHEEEVFGEAHLERLVASLAGRSAAEIAETIETEVVAAGAGEHPRDDIAILVLQAR